MCENHVLASCLVELQNQRSLWLAKVSSGRPKQFVVAGTSFVQVTFLHVLFVVGLFVVVEFIQTFRATTRAELSGQTEHN